MRSRRDGDRARATVTVHVKSEFLHAVPPRLAASTCADAGSARLPLTRVELQPSGRERPKRTPNRDASTWRASPPPPTRRRGRSCGRASAARSGRSPRTTAAGDAERSRITRRASSCSKLVPALVGLFKVGTQDAARRCREVFKMGKEYDKFWKPRMHARRGGAACCSTSASTRARSTTTTATSAWSGVKDPLQLTLDGYLYHLHHTDHERLKVTPHTLQALDEADGLLLAAREELRTSTADARRRERRLAPRADHRHRGLCRRRRRLARLGAAVVAPPSHGRRRRRGDELRRDCERGHRGRRARRRRAAPAVCRRRRR